MKHIKFIDGSKTYRIKSKELSKLLDFYETCGYVVYANKYKNHEIVEFKDVLMISKPKTIDEFFTKKLTLKQLLKQTSKVYRLIFDFGNEIVVYFLDKDEYEVI